MRKSRYNNLVLKLTLPIVVIVAVVFAVLIPYMLSVNTSIIEQGMDEQVAHLSLSVRNHIYKEVYDLQDGLTLAVKTSFAVPVPGEMRRVDLQELLLLLKERLDLDFIALTDQATGPILSFHDQGVPLKYISGLEGWNGTGDAAGKGYLELIDGTLYAVAVAESPDGTIVAGRALRKPPKMKVEAPLKRYAVVLYDLGGRVILATSKAHWARMKIPPEILERVKRTWESFSRKVTHDSKTLHIVAYGPLLSNGELKAVYSVHIPAVDILSGRNRVIKTILAFMSIGILLMIMTGYVTSKWTSRRIGNLLEGTREITRGRLGYQLRDDSGDEIGELTTSFNEMSRSLKESHEWWKQTFDSMSDGVSIQDRDCTIVKVNASLAKLLGVSVDEMIGKKCHDFLYGGDLHLHDCPLKKCAHAGEHGEIEIFHSRLNRWLSISTSPIFDAGELRHIIHVVRDITERKETEELIQCQLNRLKVLHSIEKAVSSSLDLCDTLGHLVNEVTTRLGIDAATVLLLNRHTRILEYVTSKGFRSEALKHTQLRLGESNAGLAATKRRIVSIQDLRKMPDGFARSRLFQDEDFVSYFAVPLVAKGTVKGVLELFHRSPIDAEKDWLNFLETIADQAAIAIDNSALFADLQQSRNEIVRAYDETIEGWSRALDMRDKETEGHSRRVTDLTLQVARKLGIEGDELVHIKWGALLHDIGKMGVPDRILLKADDLSEEEWEIMKRHTELAYEMLHNIDYLKSSIDIPYCHHEKWDGTGYPRGLKGKEIPLAARIFAVVDVWDALLSNRPYRPAWPRDKVVEHIRSLAGSHFDPEIVDVFLSLQGGSA